jgi:hypothetical protein
MKPLLLIAALVFMALRPAHGREWQCGRHYVETSGAFQVFADIVYNRTRDNRKEGNPKWAETVVWATPDMGAHIHPLFRMKKSSLLVPGKLYYRGKACVEYKEPEDPGIGTYDKLMSAIIVAVLGHYPDADLESINWTSNESRITEIDFYIASYHVACDVKYNPLTLGNCRTVHG